MKKIISLFSTITLLTTSTTAVTACDNNYGGSATSFNTKYSCWANDENMHLTFIRIFLNGSLNKNNLNKFQNKNNWSVAYLNIHLPISQVKIFKNFPIDAPSDLKNCAGILLVLNTELRYNLDLPFLFVTFYNNFLNSQSAIITYQNLD